MLSTVQCMFSHPTIGKPTEVEDAIFCDDNPVKTENVYQPMSVNINHDNGSGKWIMCDVSDGITYSPRKTRPTTIEGISNDSKEHLKWKSDKEGAKEKRETRTRISTIVNT